MSCNKSFVIIFSLVLWVCPAAAEGEFERQRRQALTIEALVQQVEITELKLKLKAANKKRMELEQGPVPETVSAIEKQDDPPPASSLADSFIEPNNNAAFPALPKSVFKRDARLIEIIGDVALIAFDGRRYLVRRQDKLEGYEVSPIDNNKVRLTHARTKKPLTLPLFGLPTVSSPQGNQGNRVANSVPLFHPFPDAVPNP